MPCHRNMSTVRVSKEPRNVPRTSGFRPSITQSELPGLPSHPSRRQTALPCNRRKRNSYPIQSYRPKRQTPLLGHLKRAARLAWVHGIYVHILRRPAADRHACRNFSCRIVERRSHRLGNCWACWLYCGEACRQTASFLRSMRCIAAVANAFLQRNRLSERLIGRPVVYQRTGPIPPKAFGHGLFQNHPGLYISSAVVNPLSSFPKYGTAVRSLVSGKDLCCEAHRIPLHPGSPPTFAARPVFQKNSTLRSRCDEVTGRIARDAPYA
ncbi:hypothetical protein BDV95DRAFT_290388 [Massariosphaeria phaeospora]|uniref:Uncharacterized protein n=1 Tax=Massariosphaeria phaeospora TaxID=100035 RepID=A0A7C8M639_9PLEO|nr:hypothetical protein BDV95DRAFT_290388 [Massariosphaeria phaeospora]